MRPIAHVANIIISVVTHYPHLVTPEMHGGIDLARNMVAGDMPNPEPGHEALINKVHGLLELQMMSHFSGSWPAATTSAQGSPSWPAAQA